MFETTAWTASEVFETDRDAETPIWLTAANASLDDLGLERAARAWLSAQKFSGQAKKIVAAPDAGGGIAGVAFGLGGDGSGEPSGHSSLLAGALGAALQPGSYRFATAIAEPELAAIAWGLGAYAYQRYKSADAAPRRAKLRLPDGVDAARVVNTLEAVWFVYHHIWDVDTFLDGPQGRPSAGVHILFAGEPVRDSFQRRLVCEVGGFIADCPAMKSAFSA